MGFERYMTGQNEFADMLCIPESLSVSHHVALEGNVGAGKSTVAKIFCETYGYPHIGEYVDYVNFSNGESFPQFPPANEMSVINSNPLWMKIEYRRRAHLFDSKIESGNAKIFLVERSPLSLVAFEYAKMKQLLPYEITNLLGNYSMMLDIGILKEPSGYVFLQIPEKLVEKRIIQRGGKTLDFLFRPVTCKQIDSFYSFFKARYLRRGTFIDIQSDINTPDEIALQVNQFISTFTTITDGFPFNDFCHDLLSGAINFEEI